MPHIHTEPGQHDVTVSAYIVRLDTPEPTIMLHLHRKAGVYMQFGGHLEFDENPWQAILRELREEAGYDADQLCVYQPTGSLHTMRSAVVHPQPVCLNTHVVGGIEEHYHADISFAFCANETPMHPIRDGESDTMKLFTLQMLKHADPAIVYGNIQDISIYTLTEVMSKWDALPTNTFVT